MLKSEHESTEIVGIVHPSGASGGKVGQAELWTLHFSLQPWRVTDRKLEERELSISKGTLSHNTLREMMDGIKPYDVLRARVFLVDEHSDKNSFQAELVQLIGKDLSHSDLNDRVKELQKPITMSHKFFGAFTLNRAVNWYEIQFDWGPQAIQLSLSLDGCLDEDGLFQTAESLWKGQQEWDRRIRICAADRLLQLKNDTWLDEDEKEVTADEFKQKMTLESIAVFPNEQFEFCFHDGNLFWGHVILVSGTLSEGPTDARIAG